MSAEYLNDYAFIAASQTKAALGPGSSTKDESDVLHHLVIIPTSTSPGAVTIYDGAGGTGMQIFAGGTVGDQKSFFYDLGMRAKGDSTHAPRWLITTGAAVTVLAIGKFK